MRIGLLGTEAGSTTAWCRKVQELFVPVRDIEVWVPDDPAWDGIDWNSGDNVQPVINEILDRQLESIKACDILLIYLGIENEGRGARFELSRVLFNTHQILHVVLHPQLPGRHYIRAHFRHAQAVQVNEYASVELAVEEIIRRFMRRRRW